MNRSSAPDGADDSSLGRKPQVNGSGPDASAAVWNDAVGADAFGAKNIRLDWWVNEHIPTELRHKRNIEIPFLQERADRPRSGRGLPGLGTSFTRSVALTASLDLSNNQETLDGDTESIRPETS